MNLETLSKHVEMTAGKPKPTCSLIWQGMKRETRRASTGTLAAKGSLQITWSHF